MGPGLFRLLLATVVVVYHYSSLALGHAAVYLFFALSGYWVYRMWEDKYRRTRNPYLTFVASRIWRLAPVFLLCSAIASAIFLLLPSIFPPPGHFPPVKPNWGMISSVILLGYHTSTFHPLLPAWSLDIELQFYLLAPFVLVAMKRRPVATLAVVIAGCVATAMAYSYTTLGSYLPFFLIGLLAAQYPAFIFDKRCAIGSLIALSLLLATFLLVPDLRSALIVGAHPGPLYTYNEALNVAVTLVSVPFVLSTVKNASGALDKLMADLSYSVYLFHWIPDLIVSFYFPELATKSHLVRGAYLGGVLIFTYGVSLMITLLIDRPANEARARFVRARKVTGPAQVSTISPAADPA
ncbi:MAG: acyltransferase [Paraburkholderia sp.]|uniref:acyltransferase family protein n=1 Tax=Paraburkholderia sp. TaxID=1926495 RepID=UPI003C437653